MTDPDALQAAQDAAAKALSGSTLPPFALYSLNLPVPQADEAARLAVAAAAPFIRAQALKQAADLLDARGKYWGKEGSWYLEDTYERAAELIRELP